MTQADLARHAATEIIRGLDRDPAQVGAFVDQSESLDIPASLDRWAKADGIGPALSTIRAHHLPKWSKGKDAINGPAAGFTWGLTLRHLRDFADQKPGNPWRLQHPDASCAYIAELTRRLGIPPDNPYRESHRQKSIADASTYTR